MSNFERDNEMARRIAEKVAEKGGRTFYVGGLVRDRMLGKPNKDVDIEIHGVEFEDLKGILENLGHLDERKVGDNFGILNLKGYDVDIAMPRSEKPSGEGGHKDFIIDVDPYIGYENAAKRRDFTINAMMEDVLTGEVLDYYGGKEDIKNGVIRHVDDTTYVDDPLRVLRAAQFAARFNFDVAPETVEISRKMDLTKLSRERIAGELDKALMKAEKPSVFFDELGKMNQLHDWFPEVEALANTPQGAAHHPEGDVYKHTMMVLDEAAKVKNETSNPRYFMVAALCHDFGKPLVTEYNEEKGKIQSLGHDEAGVEPAKAFIKRVYNENDMTKYVKNMVELHMKSTALTNNNSSKKSFFKMYDTSVNPKDLIMLSKCDHLGRSVEGKTFDDREKVLNERLAQFEDAMSKPHVTGGDLIAKGYSPGPKFKEMLDYAHKCRLAEVDKDTVMRQIRGQFGKSPLEQVMNTADNIEERSDNVLVKEKE